MTAARGLDLRVTTGDTAGAAPAPATGAVVRLLREHGVGAPGPDRFLSPEIETAVALVSSGTVLSAVEDVIGELS
jgi:histidine ammonia-lyase